MNPSQLRQVARCRAVRNGRTPPATLPCPDCKREVPVKPPRPHGHVSAKRCDPCHRKADAEGQADRRFGRLRVREMVPLDGAAWAKFEAACAVRRAELRGLGVFGRQT